MYRDCKDKEKRRHKNVDCETKDIIKNKNVYIVKKSKDVIKMYIDCIY